MALGTLELIAYELARGVDLLAGDLAPAGRGRLLASIGIGAVPAITSAPSWLAACAEAATAIERLASTLAEMATGLDGDAVATTQLVAALAAAVPAVRGLGDAITGLAASLPGLSDGERSALARRGHELPRRLLDRLLVDDLARRLPRATAALRLLGAVEHEALDATGVAIEAAPRRLRLDRLGQLVRDPLGALRDRHGWGDPDFDARTLLTTIRDVLADPFEVAAELLEAPGLPLALEAGGFRLQLDDTTTPPSLEASLRIPGALDETIALTAGDWQIAATLAVGFASDLDFGLRPPLDLELLVPGASATVAVAVTATRAAAAAPALLLGRPAGSRVEARAIEVSAQLAAAWSSAQPRQPLEPSVRVALRGLHLALAGDDAGPLVASLIGGDPAAGVDVALRYGPRTGLRFEAGGALGVDVAAGARLGPLTIDTVHLGLALAEAPAVHAAITAHLRLGPVTVTLERFGLRGRITAPDGGGNLGPLQVDLGVHPPAGLGLAIDGPGMSGAGMLALDPERGHYAGALVIRVGDTFVLDALGVLDRVPGGRAPWRFLAMVSARFGRVPLGLGFTLDGVGGVVGVHRAVDVEAARATLRAGAIGTLFGGGGGDLPARLRQIEALFPVTPGRHVFGPTARIGWGSPQLMRADVAVLLEVPAPVRLVVLAAIEIGVPSLEHRIVDLRLDALGVLDLGRRTLALDASLHDSKIAGYELTGDMALRLGWGSAPHLLVAIGGFHPRFAAPAGFPALRRVALTAGDNPRLRLEAYVALTSNTIQLGAHVDLSYRASGLRIAGHLHFDALIELSPFALEAELSAGVAISYRGHNIASARLAFVLSGPRPWRAVGKATIGILWWDVSVGFDVTWGRHDRPPLPRPPDLAALLHDALAAPVAWTSELAPGERAWIVPRPGAAPPGVRVHPLAALIVRQQAVPLDHRITAYGSAPLPAPVRFAIRTVRIAGEPGRLAPVTDPFAPGQFTRLGQHERLVAPSFEAMASGVRVAADPILGATARVPVDHDTVVDDPLAPPPAPRPPAAFPLQVLAVVAAHRDAASPRPHRAPRVRVAPPGFVLASRRDLAITAEAAALAGGRTTHAALREALREARAGGRRPALQIVPRPEAANAAARIVVVREDDNLRNLDFVDTVTGRAMTRVELVAAIRAGDYPGYAIRTIHGLETPVSRPTPSRDDNLG